MAYIQYAKPGDNGTWTMIEQAGAHSEYGDYDFSYWVRTMYGARNLEMSIRFSL